MWAELEDGSIVELKKDCPCIHHTGPCWLHSNDSWRARNKELIEGERIYLSGARFAFAHVEQQRLAEKRQEMISRRIARIVREDPAGVQSGELSPEAGVPA